MFLVTSLHSHIFQQQTRTILQGILFCSIVFETTCRFIAGSGRSSWHSQGSREEYQGGDRYNSGWDRGRHHRSNSDDLPEWSKSDNVFEPHSGSFDSTGAFFVTKVTFWFTVLLVLETDIMQNSRIISRNVREMCVCIYVSMYMYHIPWLI